MQALLIATALLLSFAKASLVIRLRLPNGSLQRVTIEDEAEETVATLRTRIQSQGIIPGNSTLAIKEVSYDCIDSSGKNATRISALGLSPGEIVQIITTTTTTPFLPSPSAEGSSSTLPGQPKRAKSKPTTIQQSKKGAATSIAELQRLKREMIKVTRQKPTGLCVVAVAPTVGRVLRRIATGGVALLIGRDMKETPTTSTLKSSVRTTEAGKEGPLRECVEVHAACEIFHGTLPNDITQMSLVSVPLVAEIAERLGLSIVGCAVGVATLEVRDSKGPSKTKTTLKGKTDSAPPAPTRLWSPGHVFAAAQLRTFAKGSRFVVISTAEDASTTAKTGGQGGGGPRKIGTPPGEKSKGEKPKRRKAAVDAATRAATPGLSLEAFELSDQARLMLEKGVLPRSRDECTTPAPASASAKRGARSGSSSSSSSGSNDIAYAPLRLNSPVLIQSTDTTEIDPYLLAVPLPIVAIGTGSVAPRASKKKGIVTSAPPRPPWRPPVLGVEYEHSFPSAVEMQDPAVAKKAQQHVLQILSVISGSGGGRGGGGGSGKRQKFTKEGMTARMRDVHLLAHLAAGGQVEKDTLAMLCAALGKGEGQTLPPAVLMALDLTRQSLEQAGSGGEGEDDDL